MSLLAEMGKPVGILAAILSIVQGVIWFILTLLGLLVYTCSIDTTQPIVPPLEPSPILNATVADLFRHALVTMYFAEPGCQNYIEVTALPFPNIMTPYDVHIWVSVNMAFNLLWTAASIYYLVELFKKNGKGVGVYGWMATTCLVLILDLATAIAFGLDYQTILKALIDLPDILDNATLFLLVPIFIATLAMRGYILWMVNDGFVIFTISSLIQQRKDKEARSENLSRQASFVNPTVNAMYPDSTDNDSNYYRSVQPRSAWDPMTPNDTPNYPYSAAHTPITRSTSMHDHARNAPHNNYSQRPPGMYNQEQPQKPPGGYNYMAQDIPPQRPIVLADPPKGRSTPNGQYVFPQKHIPSPDYSPPSNRRDILPIRPVLRKPPGKIGQIGRTVF